MPRISNIEVIGDFLIHFDIPGTRYSIFKQRGMPLGDDGPGVSTTQSEHHRYAWLLSPQLIE